MLGLVRIWLVLMAVSVSVVIVIRECAAGTASVAGCPGCVQNSPAGGGRLAELLKVPA